MSSRTQHVFNIRQLEMNVKNTVPDPALKMTHASSEFKLQNYIHVQFYIDFFHTDRLLLVVKESL